MEKIHQNLPRQLPGDPLQCLVPVAPNGHTVRGLTTSLEHLLQKLGKAPVRAVRLPPLLHLKSREKEVQPNPTRQSLLKERPEPSI